MKRGSLEACLLNLQKCNDSSIKEIRKLAVSGSILDDKVSGRKVVERIGALIEEVINGLRFNRSTRKAALWTRLDGLLAAIGDCTQGIIVT